MEYLCTVFSVKQMTLVFVFITSLFFLPDVPADTLLLPEVEIMAPLKQHGELADQPVAATSITLFDIENQRINEPKQLSLITPNLFLPDYGSKMTASIYVRGIGTRIDQPAMGLYIDNIPVLNKNNYDFDFFDIRRIDVLRGPQGTLYGRNTIGGVINVYTLSPFVYEGVRLMAGYGAGNTVEARAGIYRRQSDTFGWSLAMNHHQSDGFFTNRYDGSLCDSIMSNGLRLRAQWNISDRWMLDGSIATSRVNQSGFAYSPYDETTGEARPVNHNDPCTYSRINLLAGVSLLYRNSAVRFMSATGFAFTGDEMTLDQDFSPRSMFTITQSQLEKAVTQEFVLKLNSAERKWQHISGLYGFYRHIGMDAPVTFKRNGIDELILANANRGIQTVFPDAELLIREDRFVIASRFAMPAFGVSMYHQSEFCLNRLKLVAGIRFDSEYTAMHYSNSATIHYRLTLTMPKYRELQTAMEGGDNITFVEIMPRFAVVYPVNGSSSFYITASRGYKSGGFNTQIFSDVLQNRMMDNLMSDDHLGIDVDGNETYSISSAILYKPEYTWNCEAGSRFSLVSNMLKGAACLFYIDCRNQQLTVFPSGKSTGRLMSNAGHTRSFGMEVSADFVRGNFRIGGSYGYTSARFLSYSNGVNDYAGNCVPHAPQNTVAVTGEYAFDFHSSVIDRLLLQTDFRGVGKIYWNEANTLSQPFYGELGASILWKKNGITVSMWGKNLTGADYNTFYFKSAGRSFVQRGKPLQAGVAVSINL